MEGAFSAWPVEDSAGEQAIADLARSGKRGRGNGPNIAAFEQKFAQLVSAGHCLATASGTGSDRACAEAVWFTQTMLLGPRRDMDAIAEAVRKVKKYAADLARA
jgi:dTDP-4-amino-4,6-dideoxygalactose transaminase